MYTLRVLDQEDTGDETELFTVVREPMSSVIRPTVRTKKKRDMLNVLKYSGI